MCLQYSYYPIARLFVRQNHALKTWIIDTNDSSVYIIIQLDNPAFWQTYLPDLASIIMEGILIFNKHSLFLLTVIILLVGWLLFYTIYYFIEYSNKFSAIHKPSKLDLEEVVRDTSSSSIIEPSLELVSRHDQDNRRIEEQANISIFMQANLEPSASPDYDPDPQDFVARMVSTTAFRSNDWRLVLPLTLPWVDPVDRNTQTLTNCIWDDGYMECRWTNNRIPLTEWQDLGYGTVEIETVMGFGLEFVSSTLTNAHALERLNTIWRDEIENETE